MIILVSMTHPWLWTFQNVMANLLMYFPVELSYSSNQLYCQPERDNHWSHVPYKNVCKILSVSHKKNHGNSQILPLILQRIYEVQSKKTHIYLCANYFAKCATNSFRSMNAIKMRSCKFGLVLRLLNLWECIMLRNELVAHFAK